MNARIKIEKIGSNGSRILIEAECTTTAEIEEITRVCRSYAPRKKIFGVI